MTTAINFLSDFSSAEQEREALEQLCDYLVRKGKYKDSDAAHKDARQRVDFLEKADFFADDATLADASPARKSTAALIQGHNLRGLLESNAGYLPGMDAAENTADPGEPERQEVPQKVKGTAPEAARPAPGKRPITEIFGAIEMDLRTGMSPEQIITKLEDSGVARDNAEDALAVVQRQQSQKRRTRLLAAATIVILSLVLFYFAR